MKMLRFAAVLALLFVVGPASAQQVQNHAIPVGRGGGVQGFGAIVPATAGRPLIDNGAGVDPGFGIIANSGFTPGAANTVKGTLDGVNTIDVPLPSCTAVNQAWRFVSGTGINCGTLTLQTGYDMPINLGLSASASGGALTLNLTQASGAAPTSSNPVLVPFRSLTAATGTVTWSTVSSTLSITIPSSATLGTSNGVPFRVWLFVGYNAGVPQLGVATCSSSTTLYGCASWENALVTSVTINSGATAAGTLYAPAGVTLDSVRIIGFCGFANGLTTAGTWASTCTTLQPMGPGIKKPGDVVQTARSAVTSAGSGGNNYTVSNTAPTTAVGNQITSISFTPAGSMNRVIIDGAAQLQVAAGNDTAVLFLTTSASAAAISTAASYLTSSQSTLPFSMTVGYEGLAGSITSLGLYVAESSGTIRWNASGGSAILGSTGFTFLRIQEIMG